VARPREFDEDDVIHQAMDVFWRKGYQATSVRDLVDATGLQRGSIYGAFGDKHGLFLKSLRTYADVTLERFRQLRAESKDPVDAIRAFVRMGASDCTKRPMVERGCMIGNTCTELAASDPAAQRLAQRFVAAMRDAMAAALREGQRLGTFDEGRDPNAVATFIQVSMQGLTVLAKAKPGRAAIDGVVHEILRSLD
jgi:TetR/AcrR family transcriptional regulator, transcriptional repressor for nem operon